MGSNDLNLRDIIDGASRRTTLSDLQRRGINRVRLIDEKQIHELIGQAVGRIVADRAHLLSDRERRKITEAARRELGRLVKEQEDLKERAERSSRDQAGLAAEVENLQKQLAVTRDLAEQEARAKYAPLLEKLQAELAEARAAREAGAVALQQEIARRLDAVERRLEERRGGADLDGLRASLGGIARKLDTIRARVSPDDVTYRPGQVTLGDLMDRKVESNIDAIGVARAAPGGVDEAMKRLRGLRAPKR
jgi:hypothetical protein